MTKGESRSQKGKGTRWPCRCGASERVERRGGVAAGPMTWSPVPAATVREIASLAWGQGGSEPGRAGQGRPAGAGADEPPAHIRAILEADEDEWDNLELPEPPLDLAKLESALMWFVEHDDALVGEGPEPTPVGLRGWQAWDNTGLAVGAAVVQWPEHADTLHDMFDRVSERAGQVGGATYDPVENAS